MVQFLAHATEEHDVYIYFKLRLFHEVTSLFHCDILGEASLCVL